MARTVTVSGADASEAQAFTPLPEGQYIARIIDVKDTTAAKQGENATLPALSVQFKVVEAADEQYEGRRFRDFRIPVFTKWASGKSAFTFYQFFGALGVEFPKGEGSESIELPDNDEILGQEIGVNLSIDTYDGKTNNRVKGYFPASDGLNKAVAASKNDEFTLET